MGKKRLAVEKRRDQILKQLDKLREDHRTKTRKHYQSDHSFEQASTRRSDTIYHLERELSVLDDPGEYYELPIAVVSDELGIPMEQIKFLMKQGEIESSDESWDYITRDELGKLLEMGVDELLRLSNQEAPEIFERAIIPLQNGDIADAEKEYIRLESRDSCIGPYAYAYQLALEIAKGEYNILSSIRFINQDIPMKRAAILTYLGRILRGMKFQEHGAKVLAEHLLAICEGSDPYDDPESPYSGPKQHFKWMDDEQHRAMYMSTVVLNAIENVQIRNIFHKTTPKLESIIRNSIYTALYAEATYEESPASKMFVDMVRAQIPKWYEPAKLLQNLSAKKKIVSQE